MRHRSRGGRAIVALPMGASVKLVGKGTRSNTVYEPILTADQLALLSASPVQEPFDGDAGKFRLLAVAAPKRLAAYPNVPTFKEVGLEPVNRMAYYGIYGPKGLPKEVVDKINGGVKKALEDPAVRKRIEDTGSLIVANTPDQFAAQIKAEYDVYKKVVDQSKLKLD